MAEKAVGNEFADVKSSQKYVGMRKLIGERLRNSVVNAPHIYQTVEVKMDACFAFRADLNKSLEDKDVKITLNDVVVCAVAQAVGECPDVNSALVDDVIYTYSTINIGIAADTSRGLVVPVVKNCGEKGLVQISTEAKALVTAAKNATLTVEDMKGGTITISNLGAYDIEHFTSVINSPEGCILSVASIKDRAVVEDGQIVVRKTMFLTLGSDHRVIDGALGIRFLNCIKKYLESPESLVI